MSRGKYSPTCLPRTNRGNDFRYNAKGEVPPSTWDVYDTEIHFPNYDREGYDSYGYSAYSADGEYVGIGNGVDRAGYTEDDYLSMSAEEFEDRM